MLAYWNGRFVPRGAAMVSAFDLGFSAGVQVVDNCRTYHRQLFRWDDHLERFFSDCAACHIPVTATAPELTDAAEEIIARTPGRGELQVVTMATPGDRVPGESSVGTPMVGMTVYPVPVARYSSFFTRGVKLVTMGCHPAGPGLLLSPQIKHRSRMIWWLAEQAAPAGTVPVLTADTAGTVFTETAIGNLAMVVDGTVVFSDPDYVLNGISTSVTRELCEDLGLPTTTARLTKDLLAKSTEVLMMGTGFGVAGIATWDARAFAWPGPVTRQIQSAWSALVGLDITSAVSHGM